MARVSSCCVVIIRSRASGRPRRDVASKWGVLTIVLFLYDRDPHGGYLPRWQAGEGSKRSNSRRQRRQRSEDMAGEVFGWRMSR